MVHSSDIFFLSSAIFSHGQNYSRLQFFHFHQCLHDDDHHHQHQLSIFHTSPPGAVQKVLSLMSNVQTTWPWLGSYPLHAIIKRLQSCVRLLVAGGRGQLRPELVVPGSAYCGGASAHEESVRLRHFRSLFAAALYCPVKAACETPVLFRFE